MPIILVRRFFVRNRCDSGSKKKVVLKNFKFFRSFARETCSYEKSVCLKLLTKPTPKVKWKIEEEEEEKEEKEEEEDGSHAGKRKRGREKVEVWDLTMCRNFD